MVVAPDSRESATASRGAQSAWITADSDCRHHELPPGRTPENTCETAAALRLRRGNGAGDGATRVGRFTSAPCPVNRRNRPMPLKFSNCPMVARTRRTAKLVGQVSDLPRMLPRACRRADARRFPLANAGLFGPKLGSNGKLKWHWAEPPIPQVFISVPARGRHPPRKRGRHARSAPRESTGPQPHFLFPTTLRARLSRRELILRSARSSASRLISKRILPPSSLRCKGTRCPAGPVKWRFSPWLRIEMAWFRQTGNSSNRRGCLPL